MAKITKLNLETRSGTGRSACHALRKAGRLPVNLYGHGQVPENLQVATREFEDALQHDARFTELHIADRVETAMIREVQYDTYGQSVIHVDFVRVDADEKIEVEVPIELRGVPKGAAEGGILERFLTHALLIVAPRDMPERFEVNVAALGLHDAIHLKDLVLPAGAELADDPDKPICAVVEQRVEAPVAEPVTEGEAVGPEPVVKPKEEGEKPE